MDDCVYSFFDFFDEIYCINLDKRVDRWNSAKEQFKKLGIDNKVKRFSAVECDNFETRNLIAKKYYDTNIINNKILTGLINPLLPIEIRRLKTTIRPF